MGTIALKPSVPSELLIVIPAYNEAENLPYVVEKIKQLKHYNYLIVNDCSTDNTVEVCEKNHFNYISNKTNQGLSQTMRNGMKYALEHGYKYIVQIDGDGQHNVDDIPLFHDELNAGYDVVCGDRYGTNTQNNTQKKYAHSILRVIFLLKTKQKLNDPTCGMRGFNWLFMNNYIENEKLEIEPSGIVSIYRMKKIKFTNVPTVVFDRKSGETHLFSTNKKKIKYVLNQSVKMLVD